MNYSDSIKAILLAAINDLSKTPEKYAVKPGVDFIRNRKLGFKDYMLMFLTMEADCIREELYRFFGRTIDAPSKAAFYRQRKKIREDAFRNLLLAFNRKLPKKLYNGKYEFWACDGSSCDIFLNSEDKDTYFEPNGKSTRGFNQIHINAMFSLLDKRFTDILVQPARKRNEYSAFCSMVDSADIPEHSKVIFFGDRGYTSYNNFAHVIEKGQYFLIRCNDKRASGMMGYPVDTLPAFDEDISLILTRSKAVANIPGLNYSLHTGTFIRMLRWIISMIKERNMTLLYVCYAYSLMMALMKTLLRIFRKKSLKLKISKLFII